MENFEDDGRINRFKLLPQTYKLCDSCVGRLAAKIGYNLTNKKRGELLREQILRLKMVDSNQCWLCEGLTSEVDHFVSLIEKRLQSFEFDTFLIGTHVDEEILNKEDMLQHITGSDIAESIKNELNRNIGKKIEENGNKKVDFRYPDIMVIMDTMFDYIKLQIKPFYIYGRYNKFQRGIPQTKWFCRSCNGKGCRNCNYTGKLYKNSVEELIAEPILFASHSVDESFHGSGREDIDVRMLGSGRPFVIEIKDPKKRTLDLMKLTEQINTNNKGVIGVNNLRYAQKEEIATIKEGHFSKRYRVQLTCSKPFLKEKLKKVAVSLRGKTIEQFTPTRVARRRAHKIRKRQIYACEIEQIDEAIATLIIEAESGTYIKELITGDNGKTQPSVSSLLGDPCTVAALDVMEIKGG